MDASEQNNSTFSEISSDLDLNREVTIIQKSSEDELVDVENLTGTMNLVSTTG